MRLVRDNALTFRPARRRTIVIVLATPAFVLAVAFWLLPFVLPVRIGPEKAERRIRLLLERNISRTHTAFLRERGLRVPDEETARRWQADYRRIADMAFLAVKAKIPLPDLLRPYQPNYVVRALIRDAGGQVRTRYFWLGWTRFDREISSLWWYASF